MKIIKSVDNSNNILFCSGLTKQMEYIIERTDVKTLERTLSDEFCIDAKFGNNKPVAACFEYIINLCKEMTEKYNLPFSYTPPSIRLFKTNDLYKNVYTNADGFCLSTENPVLKNEDKLFDTGSIFIKSLPADIRYIDKYQDKRYLSKHSSTSHFLGLFMHEWFHNIHYNLIFNRFIKKQIPEKAQIDILNKLMMKFNIFDKFKIKSNISNYATESGFELFSETLTKLVTESIDENSMQLKQNPLDKLVTMPKFIKTFVLRELS